MARRKRRRRPVGVGRVLLTLAALVGLYLLVELLSDAGLPADVSWGGTPISSPPAPATAPAPAGESAAIQAFFTTPTLVYPDRPEQRGESPLLDAVLADVARARRTIDIAVFDFDLEPLADALIAARERGVTVRVVIDSENLETPEVAQQMGRLEEARVVVGFDDREAFMHDKVLIVDQTVTWAGSWNFTVNDTYRNNNNMLRIDSRQIAGVYTREFEQLLTGLFGSQKASGLPRPEARPGGVPVSVYFSPVEGARAPLLERLAQARHSIRFMAFSFTADEVAAVLLEQARAGVAVSGVMEGQNTGGSGSDYGRLRRGDVDVLEDGNCYILHHKVMIIDERTVVTGSYNFTGSAEESNDENLLIIDDPALAQRYLAEFGRVYEQALDPQRCLS